MRRHDLEQAPQRFTRAFVSPVPVFEKKDDIADIVKAELAQVMDIPTAKEGVKYTRANLETIGVLVAGAQTARADDDERGGGGSFSLRDVQGPTAFAFDGFVNVGTPTAPVFAPAASIGRFVADRDRFRFEHLV